MDFEKMVLKSADLTKAAGERYSVSVEDYIKLCEKNFKSGHSLSDSVFYFFNDAFQLGFILGAKAAKSGKLDEHFNSKGKLKA